MKAYRLHAGVLILALACFAASCSAEAAEDGALGVTSMGTVSISVSVAPRARISGLQDIDLTLTDPRTGARPAQNICVWSNSPAGSYTLTAAGSGPGGAFELAGSGQTVNYSVEWAASAGQSSGSPLTAETTQANLQGGDCATGSGSASLVVALAPAQLAAAEPGIAYTGVLTLLVSPQ